MTIAELKGAYSFMYHWSEEAFKEAFQNSPVGWDYHWKEYLDHVSRTSEERAMLRTLGGMDERHFDMLRIYVENKVEMNRIRYENYEADI